MAKKIQLTEEQIEHFKDMVESGLHSKQDVVEEFRVSDSKVETLVKELGITLNWTTECHCVVCEKAFRAKKNTIICPECKSTPATCIVCGKNFKRMHPYTQKTCSSECRGKYRAQSGIGKAASQKMRKTKLSKYGTLAPAEVAKMSNGGQLPSKECKWCGKEFIPTAPWQAYCNDDYGACPVCGNRIRIKDYSIGPQACSEECRMQRIYATNIERYGNKDAVNSEHAKELAKKHSIERYGYEYYQQSPEAKERNKRTSLEKYGTEYPMQNPEVQEKAKNTNQERYGVDYYSQTEEWAQKMRSTNQERYGGIGIASPIIRDKVIATNRKKYGCDFALGNEDVQAKIKETNVEKYGTAYPAVTPEVSERRKQTNLERYGSEHVFGSKEIQDKIKKKWIEKYGGPNPMYNPELAKLASERNQATMIERYGAHASSLVPELREKIEATNLERYGVPWYGMSDEFAMRSISKINEKFAEDLGKLGVSTTFEFRLASRRYDLHLDDTNVLVEIDPTYTHNAVVVPYGEPHDNNYHLMKTLLAEENSYRCIHVFDWDDSRSILNFLRRRETIYARKCNISEIDRQTAILFTEKYHLQGSCKGQDIAYGLYYLGELVQVMSFGKPRYNKHYDYELLRLCTTFGKEVVGGPSRLFKKFIKEHSGSSVLSYCDRAKFSGQVYSKIGMKLERITPPTKVWSKGSKYITDNYLRQRGYDQIFKTDYGKGTSNEQLMLENGWLPVYDCGQLVFTYHPENLQ